MTATLSPSLSRALRTIRANGGVVKMRRLNGEAAPWCYLAGPEQLAGLDVLELERSGELVRRPGVPGCEREEWHAVVKV